MVVVRAEAELDEGAGVGSGLRLPAMVGLIFLHGFLRGVVPNAGGFAVQIMFANQGGLDGAGALRIDFLLAVV